MSASAGPTIGDPAAGLGAAIITGWFLRAQQNATDMREATNRAASVEERRRERAHAVADSWRDRRWQVHTNTQEIVERFVANALAATNRVLNGQGNPRGPSGPR